MDYFHFITKRKRCQITDGRQRGTFTQILCRFFFLMSWIFSYFANVVQFAPVWIWIGCFGFLFQYVIVNVTNALENRKKNIMKWINLENAFFLGMMFEWIENYLCINGSTQVSETCLKLLTVFREGAMTLPNSKDKFYAM